MDRECFRVSARLSLWTKPVCPRLIVWVHIAAAKGCLKVDSLSKSKFEFKHVLLVLSLSCADVRLIGQSKDSCAVRQRR